MFRTHKPIYMYILLSDHVSNGRNHTRTRHRRVVEGMPSLTTATVEVDRQTLSPTASRTPWGIEWYRRAPDTRLHV